MDSDGTQRMSATKACPLCGIPLPSDAPRGSQPAAGSPGSPANPDGARNPSHAQPATCTVETGRELLTLVQGDFVIAIAVSPDGRHVLTASADGTTTIWTAADWKTAADLPPKYANRLKQ
jgi:hypothetical protein